MHEVGKIGLPCSTIPLMPGHIMAIVFILMGERDAYYTKLCDLVLETIRLYHGVSEGTRTLGLQGHNLTL